MTAGSGGGLGRQLPCERFIQAGVRAFRRRRSSVRRMACGETSASALLEQEEAAFDASLVRTAEEEQAIMESTRQQAGEHAVTNTTRVTYMGGALGLGSPRAEAYAVTPIRPDGAPTTPIRSTAYHRFWHAAGPRL